MERELIFRHLIYVLLTIAIVMVLLFPALTLFIPVLLLFSLLLIGVGAVRRPCGFLSFIRSVCRIE